MTPLDPPKSERPQGSDIYGQAIDFGLRLLWTQKLLRDAVKKIAALEQENKELRDELARLEAR
jgi:hypothetical protein